MKLDEDGDVVMTTNTQKQPTLSARNDIERKYDIVRTYTELIHNQLPDFEAFLTTFTFNNSNKELPMTCYHDYFKFFYRKLRQCLINRKANYKKPSLLLIPEKSYQCTDDKQYACTHFHGFLLVHHETLQKFNEKCVLTRCEASNQILLHPKFTNPYPLQAKINHRHKLLEQDSVDVRVPETVADTMKFANYSCKNFINSEFKDTDMVIFSRNHTSQNT